VAGGRTFGTLPSTEGDAGQTKGTPARALP